MKTSGVTGGIEKTMYCHGNLRTGRAAIATIVIIVIFTLMFSSTAPAQVGGSGGYGAMQGQVIDRFGSPISGATVTLNSGFIGDGKRHATTDVNGIYLFTDINLDYSNIWRVTVTVEYPGRADFVQQSVYKSVTNGQLVKNDVQFFNYPPSETGDLYGVLTSGRHIDSQWYDGVVYLTNPDYPGVRLFEFVEIVPYGVPTFYNFTYLPVGTYSVTGHHNTPDNWTMFSQGILSFEIIEDRNLFLQIYIPFVPVPFVEYPVPIPNNVTGFVTCVDGGTPLENVSVSLLKSTGNGFYENESTVFTDENGYYNFTGIETRTIKSTYMLVMSYEFDNRTHSRDSPDFELFNSFSDGENVTHGFVFNTSMDVNLTGIFSIFSKPANATAYINGLKYGNTPLSVALPEGEHEYTLNLSSYVDQSGAFTVVHNDSSEITLFMTREPVNPENTLLAMALAVVAAGIVAVVVLLVMFMVERTGKRRSKIFISASWKRRDDVRKLAMSLRREGFVVFDFTDPKNRESKPVPPEGTGSFSPSRQSYAKYIDRPEWLATVQENMSAIRDSDIVVMLLPCGNDATADWAYAVGLGKTTFIVGNPGSGKRSLNHLWADRIFDGESALLDYLRVLRK